ncbi:MAG: DUF998 domain-containing protein [Defluviitaleaceae bacterium]|nr:DUF998 domain-containing protein [Defluviitaleaceae bacterium]
MIKQKTLLHWLGLLGVTAFISYAVAVIFSPLAYPDYDWIRQAVSDLSADNAPSRTLWVQLSSLYYPASIVGVMAVCIAVQGKYTKLIRLGIYLFAIMGWVSAVGFAAFPLTEGGTGGGTLQDTMHMVVTGVVVILSLTSLLILTIGGLRQKTFISLGVCAVVALFLMLIGPIGMAFPEYFGLFQRFSNMISANGFGAILGIMLFIGRFD